MRQSSALMTELRAAFGFKREPVNLDDGGIAFLGFLNFASGDSEVAHALQKAWFNASGKTPCHDMRATPAQAGEYIDWLIETQWGEAGATSAAIH